jgi:hypothetical protein
VYIQWSLEAWLRVTGEFFSGAMTDGGFTKCGGVYCLMGSFGGG